MFLSQAILLGQEPVNREQLYYLACNNYVYDLTKLDTSKITNMSGLFENQKDFNQPICNWDVSNVTNMSNMFYNAYKFNQPLDSWDVSKVTNMSRMFYNARNFNQPIGGWYSWDVSNVTDMKYMFYGANKFNHSIGEWDVRNVTDMSYMFNCYKGKFCQDLDDWDFGKVNFIDFYKSMLWLAPCYTNMASIKTKFSCPK